MSLELEPTEIRVLGSLVEKDLTTPDYYPLTVAALTTACNQKSNRDPLMSLSEHQVMDALESLGRKNLAREKGGAGGRVPRYAHRLAGAQTGTYDFSRVELGVLAVLLLRGPQTPGEIRARAPRTCEFHSLGEVEATLAALAAKPNGPFVVELPREPGRRERRYAHLFAPPPEAAAPTDTSGQVEPGLADRVAALEERLAGIEAELAALREAVSR